MTRITIELNDDVAKRLGELAKRQQVQPAEYAQDALTELVLDPKAESRRMAREIVRENAELYRRLA